MFSEVHSPTKEANDGFVSVKQQSTHGRMSRGTRSMKSDYESNMFHSAIEDDDELFREIAADERKDGIMEMAKNFKPHTDL